MNRLQYLLWLVGQECNEIGKEASKAGFFGLDNHAPGTDVSNASRIHQELDDLWAVVNMLNEEFDFGYETNFHAMEAKIAKVNKYAEYSKSLGLLF